MKLQLVSAGSGARWVRLGIQTFFRQPLALMGLFLLFMALMSVATLVPLVGLPVAMTLLPAVTLGLMAATREATNGKFPLPLILLTGFRAGPVKRRAMLVLGGLYASGFLIALGVSWLVDDGGFANLYLGGHVPDKGLLESGAFMAAMWTFVGLHLPLSLLFWHAPALVYWQDIAPLKALFFSAVACLRNFWALTVFALVWIGVMVGMVLALTSLASLLNSPTLAGTLLFPMLLLLAAMFFTSLFFTYRDSFEQAVPTVPAAATD
ncbi:MAG: BPSS1780 family membrane protein [Rhodoferax sp.]|nr:BPSS1780 family membrane protein [Rhodoferax sp.]